LQGAQNTPYPRCTGSFPEFLHAVPLLSSG
jgi:hypothetical protein